LIEAWLDDPTPQDPGRRITTCSRSTARSFVAHGRTRYLTDDRTGVDREFANVFVCRFDGDGRCREFTETTCAGGPEPSVEESVVD
jgi:hypothetical protein